MAFKIYTKTGDKGETSLYGGKRLPKHHIRIESYGTVDELNSFIGVVRDHLNDEMTLLKEELEEIQNRLFTIGSNLASDPQKKLDIPDISELDIVFLEKSIDKMDEFVPPLKNFILPGGHPAVSFCHVARCVCRRAERIVVALAETEYVEEILIRYLNRLSDYLFMLSRKISMLFNAHEIKWTPRRK